MDAEPGEQVFFHGHPCWRSILGFYVKGALAAVLAGVIAGLATRAAAGRVEVGWVVAAVLVIFLLVLPAGAVRLLRITYTITSRRLTIETGLVARDLQETRIERLQNVGSRQSLLERLLGIGTVDFDTAGGAEYDFRFRGVENPKRVVRTVDRALHERQASGVR